MNCKEFEKNIPAFLHNAMDYESMADFRMHLDNCDSCREELSIQFLVNEGIKHLESGDAFDMEEELEARLISNQKKLLFHYKMMNLHQAIFTLALFVCGVVAILLWG